MTEAIIVALTTAGITALATVISQIITARKQSEMTDLKLRHQHELYEQRTDIVIGEIKTEVGRLEEKQDKHNQLIERMTIVEQSLNTAWKRIDELKKNR